MTKKRNIEDREMMKRNENICKMEVERSRAAKDQLEVKDRLAHKTDQNLVVFKHFRIYTGNQN